jgi:hypothetical protein
MFWDYKCIPFVLFSKILKIERCQMVILQYNKMLWYASGVMFYQIKVFYLCLNNPETGDHKGRPYGN